MARSARSSLSRLSRQISTRLRSVPVRVYDRALPAAGLVVGFTLGMLGWRLVRDNLLSRRAEVVLQVRARDGEKNRDREAVDMVAAFLKSARFQRVWKERATREGLGGVSRVSVQPLAEQSAVRLVLEGRPAGHLYWAASWVRDCLSGAEASRDLRQALAESAEPEDKGAACPPFSLEPAGGRERAEAARGRLAAISQKIGATEAEKAGLAAERGAKEHWLADLLERAEKARGEQERAARMLAEIEKERHDIEAEIGRLEKERSRSRPEDLTPAALAALQARERRLLETMRGVDLEDCTDRHPVAAELAGVRAGLRAVQAGEELRRLRERLAEIPRLVQQEAEAESTAKRLAAEASKEKAERAALDKLQAEIDVLRAEEKLRRKEIQDVAAERLIPVTVTPLTEPTVRFPLGWLYWVFLVGSLAAGLALAVAARRHLLPLVVTIEDAESLAEVLGVPVLGVVPRLAVLSRH